MDSESEDVEEDFPLGVVISVLIMMVPLVTIGLYSAAIDPEADYSKGIHWLLGISAFIGFMATLILFPAIFAISFVVYSYLTEPFDKAWDAVWGVIFDYPWRCGLYLCLFLITIVNC